MFVTLELVVLFLAATFYFLAMRLRSGKGRSSLSFPPSMPSLPLVGSLPFINFFEFLPTQLMHRAQKLGPIFTLKIGNRLCIVLNSRDAIEKAFVRKASVFSGRDSLYVERQFTNRKRKGITSMNYNSDYKKYRALSVNILKDFGFGAKLIMEARTALEVQSVVEFIKKHESLALDPKETFSVAVSNIIFNMCLSIRDGYEKGVGDFVKKFVSLPDYLDPATDFAPALRFVPYFKRKLDGFSRLNTEILKEIDERIQELEEKEDTDCFATMFIAREGPGYDREQLLYIIRDFCGAGIITTLTSLLWITVFLANYPDVQKRLQDEIDDNVPKERLPSMRDEVNLVHVAAFMHEVWRMRTPIPLGNPGLTLADTELEGYFIPKNTSVIANLWAVHMDPKYWDHPEEFRLERFLDAENRLRRTGDIIPFSLGRRSCAGEILARQEVFLFLTGILQNFTVKPEEGQRRIDERHGSVIADPGPFKVQFISRNK